MPGLRRGVQTRPAAVACVGAIYANQAWVVRKKAAQHFDVASGAGFDEERGVLYLPLLNLGFQSSPTREAVVSRYGEQSRCKFCVRVSLTKLVQSVLRQL